MDTKTTYRSLYQLHSLLPVFFQPWWLDMSGSDWDIAMVERNGAIVALWPYCWESKLGLKILRNPSLTAYLGPLFFQEGALVCYCGNEEQKGFLSELWAQLPRFHSVDVETTVYFNDPAFFRDKGCQVAEKLTYELPLSPDEDDIYNKFHHNHRKLIRLASECHNVNEDASYLSSFLPWHERTYSRKGKRYPYNADYISHLIKHCIERQAGSLFTAQNERDEPTAFLFTVWDEKKMYLLMSAVNTDIAHHGAGRLLIWHAIKLAKRRGLEVFDFEGSMDERVGNIYKRFGGERKTYLCISKINALVWKIKKRLLG